MKKSFFLTTALLLGGLSAYAQKTETVILKKDAEQAQTVIEIRDGSILVDGREVATYPKGNREVSKRIVIDGASDIPARDPYYAPPANTGNRALLGVGTQADERPGAVVSTVAPGSAAAAAGLKKEDRILSVDDTGIEDPLALSAAIAKHAPGDEVRIRYEREGKTKETKATLQAKEQPARAYGYESPYGGGMPNFTPFNPNAMPQLAPGDMAELQQLLDQFGMPGMQRPKLGITVAERTDGHGLSVTGVHDGSAAEKAGLKAGDVLTHWNGNVITNISTLQQQVLGAKSGKKIDIRFQRNGKNMTGQVTFAEPLKSAEL